jgi:glycosyltransferase involved in cell wall biosynthesis
LAKGIATLAGDPALRTTMGARARQRVAQRFSAERLVRDIDSLYTELLDQTGARAGRVPGHLRTALAP